MITTTTIPSLPAASSLDGTDLVQIIGDVGGTPINQKATLSELLEWLTESGGIGSGGGDGGLSGNGSPEGVTAASPGVTYLDVDNEAFYVKKTGTDSTGWLALIG